MYAYGLRMILGSFRGNFVPRGDCLFSYRFLEVISFGCIPVILADGWVLPFDRVIRWDGKALHLPEQRIAESKEILESFDMDRVTAMRSAVAETWQRSFASWDGLVETFFQEIDLMRQHQAVAA
jgi:hypothetical protein